MLDLVMASICLHNTCIVNLDGFNIDWALEAQKDAQIETNTTFRNLKKTNIFKVAKEATKQMKSLQNPRMVDGDDRNEMDYINLYTLYLHMYQPCLTFKGIPLYLHGTTILELL
jgi:hypothetical protein